MGYARVDLTKSCEVLINKHQPQEDADNFYRCPACDKETPEDVSPRDYSHIEAGFSSRGFQVWCLRHDHNIIHIDFKGQHVVADTGKYGKFGGRNYKPEAKEGDDDSIIV